ncbi:von Willebrand factor A domain-containing protein 7-like [Boleophthalmus pectinirostris]|uniref:von Willebrand factor A domain-containing protein 7-like n=1 Tax=Boleophthalmus pectinirostris TaxID=150288 RepID=UPI00242D17F5|nr:von Willebrand factor A domain-containing protein 7-like [Boleophthalmus pectinirostris]
MSGWFIVLLLPTAVLGFVVNRGTTFTHQEITQRAFLNVTVEVCRSIAQSEGRTFTAPATPYTVENVLQSCDAQNAIKLFYQNMKLIQNYNIRVDKSVLYNSPSHHFHNEMFNEGRDIIVAGLGAVKASNKKGNYEAAQKQIGKISHTLEDFYSHSNWIELGKEVPNANLLKGNGNVGTIAARTRATCRSCTGNNCDNNILSDIINEQLLTSGYFALSPSTSKPTGKCSYGGDLDGSSTVEPKGGINKDTPTSSHGKLHEKAANMAIAATSQLLEDVRAAGGDSAFLQMLGAKSGKPLCFVVDTTGSMTADIAAVQRLTSTLISNVQAGVQPEPSVYILVPFKDPNVGPLFRTTDANEFKIAIDSLTASGGGDRPEVTLSGLQMAVNGAPPGSDIFLFTDASAKDTNLKESLMASIEQKKSTVNILMTGVPESLADLELYEEVAQSSGGQLLRVSKSELALATDIVLDSSGSSSVTLLDEVRKPGKSENFTFIVDDTTNNVIAYITGAISSVTFVNPSGQSQTSAPVIASSTTVGNFRRIKLNKQVGIWQMRVVSDNPYTAKIVGDSPLDFIYDFLGPAQGPLGGEVASESRPKSDAKGSMELTLIGSETATVTSASLLNSKGRVDGTVTKLGNKEYLVEFNPMPTETSTLLVRGSNSNDQATASSFQRISSGKIKTSSLSVTADELNGLIEPGTSISIPFTVSSDKAGVYTVTATNDKGFSVVYPSSLGLSGGKADGTVILTAPLTAESGSEVTLTIQAEDSGKTDMNYATMSFTVLKKVTDFSSPVCEVLSQTSCPQSCGTSMWQLYARVSDGTGGTGVENVYIRRGDGTLTSRLASGNAKTVTYEASCCSTEVEIVAVDSVGNVGTCNFQRKLATTTTTTTTVKPNTVNGGAQTTASKSPKLMQSSLLCLILCLLGFHFTN